MTRYQCHVLAALTCLLTLSSLAGAQTNPDSSPSPPIKSPKRFLLVPVDDRPAVSQFAKMIGAMAGVEIDTPPSNLLGQFLQPGSPSGILNWLNNQDLTQYDAIIVNTDMIAYGGLIASRVDRSSYSLASSRLRELWRIRKKTHDTPWYAFSALMRIAPTATDESLSYRTDLYYWAIAKEKYRLEGREETYKAINRFEAKIPKDILTRYVATRQRNVDIQKDLVKMVYHGCFNQLVLGQDDAAPVGPNVPETAQIKAEISRLKVSEKVRFCAGIDQISNNLVSRVLSDLTSFQPTIRVTYTEDDGRRKIAAYETSPIEQSLREQIVNSGGRLERPGDKYDYTLYVNTPDPAPGAFESFLTNLKLEADQGFPIAVADTNLGWTGTADPELFEALSDNHRAPKLLSYAGWNTAGNTMGTTIPAANAYLLARHAGVDPYQREVAVRTFILHRLVNDYYYHRYVRPDAYKLIEKLQKGRRDQVKPEFYPQVNEFVSKAMLAYLRQTFSEQIQGRPFTANGITYRAVDLKNVTAKLPWPRAYEVFLDFELDVQPADKSLTSHQQ